MQRILNYIPRASVRQTHTYQYRCLSTNSPPPPRLAKDLELLDIASETHRRPRNVGDWLAWGMAQFIVKGPLLWGFRKRYIHPAVCVETISGVHGMVAGMARHLKSLRRMRHDYGWTHLLLHEAENERVHLMIWMRKTNPGYLERISVTVAQAAYFLAYGICYTLLPGVAHRTTAYIEEESVKRYTSFIEDIDNDKCENTHAPDIAREYYNFPENATIRDVAVRVRVDKASHRDIAHHLADRIRTHDENLYQPYNPKKTKLIRFGDR